jgi:ribosome-binding factor A
MKRMTRVNELLKREISTILERRIVPQVDGLITVTGVETSPDLRQAVVFFSVYLGDSEAVLTLLRKERGDIQREMSSAVTLKYTPRLNFRLDTTAEDADRVMQLIDQIESPPPDAE